MQGLRYAHNALQGANLPEDLAKQEANCAATISCGPRNREGAGEDTPTEPESMDEDEEEGK
jgi:ribosomal protein L12E/L44/L45/RPP1/RPP2